MDFKTFCYEMKIKTEVELALRGITATVEIENLNNTKVNAINAMAMIIRSEGEKWGSTINLEECYEAYCNRLCGIRTLADRCVEKHCNSEEQIEILKNDRLDYVFDFDVIKEKIGYRIINTEINREMLANHLNRPVPGMDDLSMIYCLNMDAGIIKITNSLAKTWNVSEVEINELAMKNSYHIYKPKVSSMSEILNEMLSEQVKSIIISDDEKKELVNNTSEDIMYVATSCDKKFGAGVILLDEVKDDINRISGGRECYILPSSLHEVIIVPKRNDEDIEILKNMVNEVNVNEVSYLDLLSNNVYEYNPATRQIRTVTDEAIVQKRNMNIIWR